MDDVTMAEVAEALYAFTGAALEYQLAERNKEDAYARVVTVARISAGDPLATDDEAVLYLLKLFDLAVGKPKRINGGG